MTLTVRLKPELESALEMHCAERGLTKSAVVQRVLADYLAGSRAASGQGTRFEVREPSAAYKAFEAAGVIGCVSGVGPANKAGVRAAIAKRLAERKARRDALAAATAKTLASAGRGRR